MGRRATLLPRSRTGKVSIRSPHKQEETFIKIRNCVTIDGFNPLPSQKQGETDAGPATHRHLRSFNPLPSQKQGETQTKIRLREILKSFNPLPSQKQGETIAPTSLGKDHLSFNPLPSQKQGETQRMDLVGPEIRMFQSAPLTKARGDGRRCGYPLGKRGFQSAPLTKARGDDNTYQHWRAYIKVSIRSPHKSKGRRLCPIGHLSVALFQSAPLTKARGDFLLHTRSCEIASFNPLPSQKQGETNKPDLLTYLDKVSIRSPHKSKGRRGTASGTVAGGQFQSAPLTKARGDAAVPAIPDCPQRFNPLPSQKQGET